MVQVEEADPVLFGYGRVAAVGVELVSNPDGQNHVESDSSAHFDSVLLRTDEEALETRSWNLQSTRT